MSNPNTHGAAASLPTETRYYIALTDDRKPTDVGLVAVNYEYGAPCTHWVSFPNGTVRKMYNSKRIDKVTYETQMAFQTMPCLHVSYRPAILFISECALLFSWILISSVLLVVMLGVGYMAANMFDLMDEFRSWPFVQGASNTMLVVTPLSFLLLPLSNWADNVFRKLSPDDLKINKQAVEEAEKRDALLRGANV